MSHNSLHEDKYRDNFDASGEFEEIFRTLRGTRLNSREVQVHCPAHDDRNPSCSVTLAGDKILVHCHAGCPQKDLVEAFRTRGFLLNGRNGYSRDSQSAKPIYYTYLDENKNPLHRTIRKPDKSGFPQEHWDGSKWVKGLGNVRRVLYRLDELYSFTEVMIW